MKFINDILKAEKDADRIVELAKNEADEISKRTKQEEAELKETTRKELEIVTIKGIDEVVDASKKAAKIKFKKQNLIAMKALEISRTKIPNLTKSITAKVNKQ